MHKSLFVPVSIAALASALSGCGEQPTDPRTLAPLVRTGQAGLAGNDAREFTGVVAARVESDLGFRVGGKVVARMVNTGEFVRRGQVLMRIDATDLALANDASSARVEAARALARQTSAEETRMRGLVDAGAVSASSYDQAKAAADVARAQLKSAEAQARVARNDAGYTVLVADADGVVVETLAEPGQVVAAGQTVIRIASAGPREALIQLPETIRPSIGSAAQARTYSGASGSAVLRELSGAANPATRTFAARYVLDGEAAKAPLGATVTITLAQPAATPSLEVPLGAIRDLGKGPGVWIVRTGQPARVVWRPVQIATIGEETAFIRSGLRLGDTFVTMGAHLLHQNQAVRVARP